MGSEPLSGPNGAFEIRLKSGQTVFVTASDGRDWGDASLPGAPWEHVSVRCSDRCPTWLEMHEVRHCFWKPEELVVQFHVSGDALVKVHPYVLHMWRPLGIEFPLSPPECV